MSRPQFPELPREVDPLEQLFRETAPLRAKTNVKLGEVLQSFSDLYGKDANWRATRVLALVHRPSGDLLGNFQELIHRSAAGARKLVRVEGPCIPVGTEEVTGAWWLTGNREVGLGERTAWNITREVVEPTLEVLGLTASSVPLLVRINHTFLARVELAADTWFTSPTGEALLLPANTNILKGLSPATKRSLWNPDV